MPAAHRAQRARAARQTVAGAGSASRNAALARGAGWFPLLACAAALAAYADALGNAFVWDDGNLIVGNPLIKHWTDAAHLFTSSLERNTLYYRPMLGLSFLVDYQLFGLWPPGFHLTSVLIHAAVGVLLYILAVRLLADRTAALFAALLFVVHPVHTEAVTYVSGRSDPLAALFTLAALICFLEQGWLLLSVGAFILALLSRETSMGVVLLIVLVDVVVALRRGERLRGTWGARITRRYLPFIGAVIIFLVVRSWIVGDETVSNETAAFSLATRLLTLPRVVVAYLGLLAFPAQLHMERVVPPAMSPLAPAVLGPTGILALIVAAAFVWRHAAWPVGFGCAWFALALLPVANLIPLATFMAEHWLYVPSMGLFIAAGWGLARLGMRAGRSMALAILALLVFGYGARTVRRNLDWRDERTFYEATLRLAPESARIHSNLGLVYWRSGDSERAKQEFARAIELRPNHWQTADSYNHLGVIYQQEDRHLEALQEFRRAIELYPRNPSPYVNLATSLQALGRLDESRRALESAIALDGRFAIAYSNLGNLSFNTGDLDRARDLYLKAIDLDPELGDAHNNLGSVYFSQGRFDLAARSYETALRLNPNSPLVRRNLESALRARAASQPR